MVSNSAFRAPDETAVTLQPRGDQRDKLTGLCAIPASPEVSTQNDAFRVRCAKHDVDYHDTGVKRLCHPVAGELDPAYAVMKLATDEELTMFVYTAEPGSRSEESLRLLASWTATLEGPITVDAPTATEEA